MGKTKKHENTFINKGLSIATFDHQIIFLPGSALSMNNQCFCWCFLCSCLKTLSLAPSLPLQALLLLLELVHLCPLRAEFRIGKAYPAEVSSSIYIYIYYIGSGACPCPRRVPHLLSDCKKSRLNCKGTACTVAKEKWPTLPHSSTFCMAKSDTNHVRFFQILLAHVELADLLQGKVLSCDFAHVLCHPTSLL